MPTPNAPTYTLRPDLQDGLEAYDVIASQNGFIGSKVFPVIEVATKAGQFGKLSIEALLQSPETRRAPRSGYNRRDWEFTTDTYSTQEYGFEDPVDDNDAAAYKNFFDYEQIAAEDVRAIVNRDYEQKAATLLYDTSYYPGSNQAAVTTPWGQTGSKPRSDVRVAKAAIYAATGKRANTVVLNYNAWLGLQLSSDIIDQVKYSGLYDPTTKGITNAAIAAAFDVENVWVADAQYNSANEGLSAVLSPIYSNAYCWVGITAKTNNIKEPCFGRTFHWDGDGSVFGGAIEEYRDEPVRADIIRCRMQYQLKRLLPTYGFLLSNIG